MKMKKPGIAWLFFLAVQPEAVNGSDSDRACGAGLVSTGLTNLVS
jgi:hypothetical protein